MGLVASGRTVARRFGSYACDTIRQRLRYYEGRLIALLWREGVGKMVKIRYARGETGWAEEMGNGTYRIDNVPLTDRLNIDDLVRCRRNEAGELVVRGRVKRRYPEKTAIRYEKEGQYRL